MLCAFGVWLTGVERTEEADKPSAQKTTKTHTT